MALLSDEERRRVATWLMRNVRTDWGGALKAELLATVAALDDYIEANQSAINTAIPVGPRGKLSLDDKTRVFCAVAMRRAGLARVDEDS